MGSRLAYGMARQGLLPRPLGRVHPVRRTPRVAVGALLVVAVALALVGEIEHLASATVLLLMTVFVIVNAALIALKLRPGEPLGGFEVPIAVPALGSVVCLALLTNRVLTGDWPPPVIACVLIPGILALYAFLRPEPFARHEA